MLSENEGYADMQLNKCQWLSLHISVMCRVNTLSTILFLCMVLDVNNYSFNKAPITVRHRVKIRIS